MIIFQLKQSGVSMGNYVKTKACPRCVGGDLFIEQYKGRSYEFCIQCSYSREIPETSLTHHNPNSRVQSSSIDDKVTSVGRSGQGGNKGTSQNLYKPKPAS